LEETQDLLQAWRRAQADLEAAEPGTVQWYRARDAVEAAANAYQLHIQQLEGEADELAADPGQLASDAIERRRRRTKRGPPSPPV